MRSWPWSTSIRRRRSPSACRGAPSFSYLRDWVYGGIDGAVTTFAIVAGVVGAELSNRVVLILGVANLVADGFSMAASNYSGTKTEHEEQAHLRAIEERHIEAVPEGEREEIRQIFRGKGFRGRDLERAVDVITADRERWVDTMLAEEYGLPKAVRSPLKAAASTFAAFVLCGAVPLLPFLVGAPASFPAFDRHDRAGVLPDRLDQEPLVAGQLVALGRRDPGDRARRRGARLPGRPRSEEPGLSARADDRPHPTPPPPHRVDGDARPATRSAAGIGLMVLAICCSP